MYRKGIKFIMMPITVTDRVSSTTHVAIIGPISTVSATTRYLEQHSNQQYKRDFEKYFCQPRTNDCRDKKSTIDSKEFRGADGLVSLGSKHKTSMGSI